MSNPLLKIFSNEEPTCNATLFFETDEDRKQFVQTVYSAEKAEEITGVKKIEHFLENGDSKYLVDNHSDIVKLFIYPHYEDIPYSIDTDYGEYVFNLKRFNKGKMIVLKNDEKDITHIKIAIDSEKIGEPTITFNYKLNPRNAKNIEEIIKSYNALGKLLSQFISEKSNQQNGNIAILQELEFFWKRAREIETKVNVHFNPANIDNSIEDRNNIEKIYILLIDRFPVRTNLNDLTLTLVADQEFNNNDFKQGSKMAVSFVDTVEYTVYGEKISIDRQNFVFQSVIDSIDYNSETNEYKVKYVGTETKPLYRVFVGHVPPADITEKVDFNRDYKKYSNAKTFNEIVSEQRLNSDK